MSRKRKWIHCLSDSPVSMEIAERMYTGGPMEREKIPRWCFEKLDKEQFIEKVMLDGQEFWQLNDEGNYFMGATHEELGWI